MRYHGIDWNWEEWWNRIYSRNFFSVSNRESDVSRTIFLFFSLFFLSPSFFYRTISFGEPDKFIFPPIFLFFFSRVFLRPVFFWIGQFWFFFARSFFAFFSGSNRFADLVFLFFFSHVFFRPVFLLDIFGFFRWFFRLFFLDLVFLFFFFRLVFLDRTNLVFFARFFNGRWKHLLFFK